LRSSQRRISGLGNAAHVSDCTLTENLDSLVDSPLSSIEVIFCGMDDRGGSVEGQQGDEAAMPALPARGAVEKGRALRLESGE
jgi:hypothetical protein